MTVGEAPVVLPGRHRQRGLSRSENSVERPVQIDGGVLSDGGDETIAASASLLLLLPPDVLGREAHRRERAEGRRGRGRVRLFRRDSSSVGGDDGGRSTESESST